MAYYPAGQDVASAQITTGTTTPSATLAAPGAGSSWIVTALSVALAATSNQAPLLFQLIEDKAGTPVVLWRGTLAALANTCSQIVLENVEIPQASANKTLHLEATSGTIVSGNFIAVFFTAQKRS